MAEIAKVPVVCSVILARESKILLVQEAKPAIYGLWNFPGGRVDAGETLEQAAVREAREEVGFEVALGTEVLLLHRNMNEAVLHAFTAEIVGGTLAFPPDEILDTRWFTIAQIKDMRTQLRNDDYVLGALTAAGLL